MNNLKIGILKNFYIFPHNQSSLRKQQICKQGIIIKGSIFHQFSIYRKYYGLNEGVYKLQAQNSKLKLLVTVFYLIRFNPHNVYVCKRIQLFIVKCLCVVHSDCKFYNLGVLTGSKIMQYLICVIWMINFQIFKTEVGVNNFFFENF